MLERVKINYLIVEFIELLGVARSAIASSVVKGKAGTSVVAVTRPLELVLSPIVTVKAEKK